MAATYFDPTACGPCMEWYYDQPHLPQAAASVGIEHGKSTAEMLHTVLAVYHRNGHRDSTPNRNSTRAPTATRSQPAVVETAPGPRSDGPVTTP